MSLTERLLPTRRVRAVAGTLALASAAGAGVAAAVESSTHTVEVVDDEVVLEHRQRGGTIGEVLDELGVDLGPADLITHDPDHPVEQDLTVVIDRAITVEVELHGTVARRIHAPVGTVAGVLHEADLNHVFAVGAAVSPSRDTPVADGDVISVTLPVPVTLEVDGEVVETLTLASTVESVLALEAVEVGPDDIVSPGHTGSLLGPTTITVQRVAYEDEVVEVVLEHGLERRESASLDRGTERVAVPGQDGRRLDTYHVTLVDGEEVERERVDQRIVEEPVDRVVEIGTRAPAPAGAPTGSVWDRLAQCESGGNWRINTGNGYYGGLQFHPSTWRSVGGTGLPHEHSREEQIRRGQILQQRAGWGQWPACARRLGLR